MIERLRRLIHGPLAEVFDRLTTGALDRHCTVFDLRDPRAAQPDIPRLVAQVINVKNLVVVKFDAVPNASPAGPDTR